MSGFPTINPTDASKFRQNYLANLALQAQLNDMNLQANKVYKKTGQTPSQVTDTRLTAEKLADVERLKIDVRSQLTQIADGQQADSIVQQLSPEALRYTAQHIIEIINEIKPKYKLGVIAEIFIPYINKRMQMSQETQDVNYGLQQTTGRHILLGLDQIMNDMVNQKMLDDVAVALNESSQYLTTRLEKALERDVTELKNLLPSKAYLVRIAQLQDVAIKGIIQEELNDALRVLPTQSQITTMLRELRIAIVRKDSQNAERIGSQLHQLLSVEPVTREQIANIQRSIDEASAESRADARATQRLIMLSDNQILATIEREIDTLKGNQRLTAMQHKQEIIRDLTRAVNSSQVETIADLKQALKDEVESLEESIGTEGKLTRNLISKSNAQLVSIIENEIESVKGLSTQLNATVRNRITEDLLGAIKSSEITTIDELKQALKQELSDLGIASAQPVAEATASSARALPDSAKAQRIRNAYRPLSELTTQMKRKRYIDDMIDLVVPVNDKSRFFQATAGRNSVSVLQNLEETGSVIKELNRLLRIEGYGEENPVGVGKGLKKSRMRGGSVLKQTDYSQGIMPTQQYVPFGRYHINNHKLNDNIIAVRRHTGCNVVGFPVERVSNDLGNILRTIVGGGQPQFHHLEKLSDEEKLYLHKLSKASNILDRISIPTPNKDDDDKDINQFEILKGEILSGNDSGDLVKRFKILIMKMVKKDLLPKSQAKEILMDLVSIGY
jgi:hypothetical protein